MPRPLLRLFEGHTAAASMLVYLLRKSTGRSYRREIEHEMYIQVPTAIRTLDFLMKNGFVTDAPGYEDGAKVARRFYALTSKGRQLAQVFDDAERALEKMRDEGLIPGEPED